VPQVYVGPKGDSGWEAPRRLAGFKKVDLAPGASTKVSVTVDPRLLATFDSKAKAWTIAAGAYEVSLGASSRDLTAKADVTLAAKSAAGVVRREVERVGERRWALRQRKAVVIPEVRGCPG
jgi:beta-glucosidase